MWTPGLGILTKVRKIVGPQDEINDLRRELSQLEQVVTKVTQRYQNNLPLPPAELRLHVGMRTSAINFLAQGSNSSERVLEVFGRNPEKPMLDWGCGTGRTLRWLMTYPAWLAQYHGCDVDTAAISWLKENGLRNVAVCNDDPPLPYPDAMFGGVFAYSVLTHIPAEKHRVWYEELRRVLEPGGLAYLTTQGIAILENPIHGIPDATKTEFYNNGHAYLKGDGHYKDAAFVSEQHTLRLLEGLFKLEYYKPEGYNNMDAFLVRAI